MEIHKKLQNDVPVLDAEGKICALTSSIYPPSTVYPKSDLKCTECNIHFATQKSLTTHIKVSFFYSKMQSQTRFFSWHTIRAGLCTFVPLVRRLSPIRGAFTGTCWKCIGSLINRWDVCANRCTTIGCEGMISLQNQRSKKMRLWKIEKFKWVY